MSQTRGQRVNVRCSKTHRRKGNPIMNQNDKITINRPHIVAVDDQAASLQLIREALGDIHLDCRTFQDPRAALAAMTAAPPDVLITDVFMPGLDGFQLAALTRQQCPNTLIIGVSSALGIGCGLDCGPLRDRLKADFLFAKPLDPIALFAALACALRSPLRANRDWNRSRQGYPSYPMRADTCPNPTNVAASAPSATALRQRREPA